MKNILVGVTHKNESPIILQYALKLSQFFQASITAAYIIEAGEHVIYDGDLVQSNLSIEDINDRKEGFRQKERNFLAETIERLTGKELETLPVQTIAKFGVPKTELSHIAMETKADLMIIRSKTASTFLTWLFKDEGRAIVNQSPCPVLSVPDFAEYHGFNRLVYASDFLFDDLEALLFLQEWAAAYDAKLHCVHVCQKESDKAVAIRKMDWLKRLFPNMEPHIFTGDIGDGIDDYFKLTATDLVATTAKKRHFWQSVFNPSVSSQIVADASIPMLFFKEET